MALDDRQHLGDGLRVGLTVDDIHKATDIDPWFLEQMRQIIAFEDTLRASAGKPLDADTLRDAKEHGFSDRQIAELRGEGACPPRSRWGSLTAAARRPAACWVTASRRRS